MIDRFTRRSASTGAMRTISMKAWLRQNDIEFRERIDEQNEFKRYFLFSNKEDLTLFTLRWASELDEQKKRHG